MTATLDAFRSSLQRGSGRAMLILRENPGDAVLRAALFHSCTVNEVFDTQCEEARAAYLRRLILATGQVDAFRRDLAAHLAAAGVAEGGEGSEESEGGPPDRHSPDLGHEDPSPRDFGPKDFGQTFELLCLLAADEPTFDRRVLWDFLARTDFETARFGCADALVRLDGLPALLHCVEHFRQDYAEANWELGHLLYDLRERDGEALANETLEDARRTSPALDHLLTLVPYDGPWSTWRDQPSDYRTLKAELDAGERSLFPGGWSLRASPEDLALAAADLLAETDDLRRRPYLHLFFRIPFPLDPEPLFPLLKSEHKRVRFAARRVFGQMCHPGVRQLALAAIADGAAAEWFGLHLLQGSAEPGDSALFGPFIAAARAAGEIYVVHWAYMGIVTIIENDRLPLDEGVTWLVRVYGETPCSTCRRRAVENLMAVGRVPDWIAAEWSFDAAADAVALNEANA
jgi:hypothetical protein